jgi:molybdate transport system permease protein
MPFSRQNEGTIFEQHADESIRVSTMAKMQSRQQVKAIHSTAVQVRASSQPTARRGKRHDILVLLSIPLLLFLLLPVISIVVQVPPSLIIRHLGDEHVVQAISLSLGTSLLTTAITIASGTPLALLLARRHFRGRHIVDAVIDAPMVLPPAVAGVGLLLAFGRHGLVGAYLHQAGLTLAFTQAAVVMAQLFVAAPFYVRAAITGFGAFDREIEQAAALDGASGWQSFWRVTVPLAGPALLGGAVMTWARALGEFGATIIFAGNLPGRTQTMPLAIYLGFEMEFNVALTLAVILLLVSFGVLLVVKSILRSRIMPV